MFSLRSEINFLVESFPEKFVGLKKSFGSRLMIILFFFGKSGRLDFLGDWGYY